jgi:hypothetical protein
MRVKIEFREDANKAPSMRSRKGKQQAVIKPNGKGKGRAADEEPIEEFGGDMDDSYFQDFDDDIVNDEPLSAPASRQIASEYQPGPSRSVASAPAANTTIARSAAARPASTRSVSTLSDDDLHARHLDALRAWRGEMAAREGCNDQDVLSDEVLQMLVLMPPNDGISSVEALFTMWMTPDSDLERNDLVLKAHKYGPQILAIFATDKTSPPSFSRPPSAASAPVIPPPASVAASATAAPVRVRSFKPVELHERFDYRPGAGGNKPASKR